MLKPKLLTSTLTVTILASAALHLWQNQQLKRLQSEITELRHQTSQVTGLREENQRLADQIKATGESAESERRELIRLRGQISKLRQLEKENARLTMEHQQRATQAASSKTGTPAPKQEEMAKTDDQAPVTLPHATNLGEVELSHRLPSRFDLGEGRECVVLPIFLEGGKVAMGLTIEGKDAEGKPVVLGRMRIQSAVGMESSVSVGEFQVTLVPKLKAQP